MKTEQAKASRSRERRTGRPSKNPQDVNYTSTALHSLLVERLSHVDGIVRNDKIDTAALARGVGVARWTVYRWFNEGISSRAVRKLIDLSRPKGSETGTLTDADLLPHIKL